MAAILLAGAALLAAHGATHPSIAWFLIVARTWSEGATLYLDIRDLNLPFTHLLFRAAHELGEGLALAPHRAFYLLVAGWFLATLGLTAGLLRRLAAWAAWQAALLAAGAVGILACWPLGIAGERDHLALLGFLPYLAACWRRLSGPAPATGPALVAGLMATPGLVMRPYLLAVPLMIELYLLLRAPRARRWRSLFRPETGGLCLGLLLLGGLPLLLYPAFLERVAAIGWLYAGLDLGTAPARLWFLLGGLSLLLGLGWRGAAPWLQPATLLAVAALGVVVSTLLQGRWQDYHLAPAEMLGLLAALLALALSSRPAAARSGSSRRALAVAALLLALSALGWAGLGGYRQLRIHHLSSADPYPPGTRALAALLDGEAAGRTVAILAYDGFDFLPAVYLSRAAWALQDETQYLLGAFYVRQRQGRFDAATQAAAATLRREVLDRLVAAPPRLIGIYRGGAEQGPYPEVQDIAAFYGEDPRFAALLDGYEEVATLQGITYFRRRE